LNPSHLSNQLQNTMSITIENKSNDWTGIEELINFAENRIVRFFIHAGEEKSYSIVIEPDKQVTWTYKARKYRWPWNNEMPSENQPCFFNFEAKEDIPRPIAIWGQLKAIEFLRKKSSTKWQASDFTLKFDAQMSAPGEQRPEGQEPTWTISLICLKNGNPNPIWLVQYDSEILAAENNVTTIAVKSQLPRFFDEYLKDSINKLFHQHGTGQPTFVDYSFGAAGDQWAMNAERDGEIIFEG
jgi:hypothetical protein